MEEFLGVKSVTSTNRCTLYYNSIMKLKMTKAIEVHIEQFPCMNCGYDGDLKFYHDTKYCTATITCPKCDRSERGTCDWNLDFPECVEKVWNPANDRKAYIESTEAALANLPALKKHLIAKLKALQSGAFLKNIGV